MCTFQYFPKNMDENVNIQNKYLEFFNTITVEMVGEQPLSCATLAE